MAGLDWNDPLRIRTVQEMINYINQVGFLPLFANELPVFPQRIMFVPSAGDGGPEQDPWLWRELIAAAARWLMGSF